jgi:glycine cleavage system regulatory protein
MKNHAILSATGDDHLGVADELTASLATRAIEIEESRWTSLKGRFAMVVEISGPSEALSKLARDLGVFGSSLGYHLHMKPLEARPAMFAGERLFIESTSHGPAGVAAVTAMLRRQGVNIDNLETDADADSWDSRLTFHMRAHITVPPSCPHARLEQALRELESERNVEVSLSAAFPAIHGGKPPAI